LLVGSLVLSTGVCSAGAVIGPVSPAHATPVTSFTWTGKAAKAAHSANDNWSDGANWKGGVAPSAPGPVDLAFTALTCSKKAPACATSNNDISGLTVQTLTLTGKVGKAKASPPAIDLTGDALTVTGGIDETTKLPKKGTHSFPNMFVDLAVQLSGDQTWNMNGWEVGFPAPVTGAVNLTIDFQNQGGIGFEAAGNSMTSVTGSGVGLLFVAPGASLNTAGNPVTMKNGSVLYGLGAVGPLATSSAGVDVGNVVSPYGTLQVDGAIAFDSGSSLSLYDLTAGSGTPVAGTDYPQVLATGAVNLSSAGLNVFSDCGLPLGTAYTLLSASGGLSGTVTEGGAMASPGTTITSGMILQAPEDLALDPSCNTATPSYLQFTYAADALVATVVAPPPTAGPASHHRSVIHHVPATPVIAVDGAAGHAAFTTLR
jgi:hypothetical protein